MAASDVTLKVEVNAEPLLAFLLDAEKLPEGIQQAILTFIRSDKRAFDCKHVPSETKDEVWVVLKPSQALLSFVAAIRAGKQ